MAKVEKRKYKLSVYLLKKDVATFEDALKSRQSVTQYPLKGSLKLNGVIYIGATKRNEFAWQDLLQQGTDKKIPRLSNSSNRAVLFFKIQGRVYALPFGFGKHLIREDSIEREFGLRAALNIIDPDKLRSIDKANLDDLAVLTRTQTSRRASPQEFNLDVVRDLMRGVTGEPISSYSKLGGAIAGSEGIYLLPSLHFEDIPGYLEMLKTAYQGKAYKERFDWIDNLKYERDPAVISKLQDRLIEDLSNEITEGLHLFPPRLIDWESYEGISFTQKGDVYTELDITSFYDARADNLEDLDWEKLKRLKLFIKYSNNDEAIPAALINSLSYQVTVSGVVYVLAFSQWYRVNKSFNDYIVKYINGIKESKLVFINCDLDFEEKDYNKALVGSSANFKLFDRVSIKADAIRSRVELCDVYAMKEKELIHVKPFKGSSDVLSHLFSQGKVSGSLIARDAVFRRNVRTKFKEAGIPVNLMPESQESIDCSNYTITFAVIAKGNKSFQELLPFFSQLNLMLTVQELRVLGFTVKVKKISYV